MPKPVANAPRAIDFDFIRPDVVLNKGFPLLSTDQLLADPFVKDQVYRIRYGLDLSPAKFQDLIMPIIRTFADTVHLLPGSAAHHHREPGGHLRHSLEVAKLVAKLANANMAASRLPPTERNAAQGRMKVAAALAGLLHDVGKVATDMIVFDQSGEHVWMPGAQTLLEWGRSHNLDRYFMSWRDHSRREGTHERALGIFRDSLITPAITQWLISNDQGGKGDHSAYRALMAALSGQEAEWKLHELVTMADTQSTKWDMAKPRDYRGNAAPAVPVARHIVEAIKCFIMDGTWEVNKPGGYVWHILEETERGLFVNLRGGHAQLVAWLKTYGVNGVPKDADSMAVLLAESSTIHRRIVANGVDNFWHIRPANMARNGDAATATALECVRLIDINYFFNMYPPVVKGLFGRRPLDTDVNLADVASTLMSASRKKDKAAASQEPRALPLLDRPSVQSEPPSSDDSDLPPAPPLEAYEDDRRDSEADLSPPPSLSPTSSPKLAVVPERNPPQTQATLIAKCPECNGHARLRDTVYICDGCGSVLTAEQIGQGGFKNSPSPRALRSKNTSGDKVVPLVKPTSSRDTKTPSLAVELYDEFSGAGLAGNLIIDLCKDIAIGRRARETTFLGEKPDDLWLDYDLLTQLNQWNKEPGEEPWSSNQLIKLLAGADWLLPNHYYQTEFLQSRLPYLKVVVFKPSIALKIQVLLQQLIKQHAQGQSDAQDTLPDLRVVVEEPQASPPQALVEIDPFEKTGDARNEECLPLPETAKNGPIDSEIGEASAPPEIPGGLFSDASFPPDLERPAPSVLSPPQRSPKTPKAKGPRPNRGAAKAKRPVKKAVAETSLFQEAAMPPNPLVRELADWMVAQEPRCRQVNGDVHVAQSAISVFSSEQGYDLRLIFRTILGQGLRTIRDDAGNQAFIIPPK